MPSRRASTARRLHGVARAAGSRRPHRPRPRLSRRRSGATSADARRAARVRHRPVHRRRGQPRGVRDGRRARRSRKPPAMRCSTAGVSLAIVKLGGDGSLLATPARAAWRVAAGARRRGLRSWRRRRVRRRARPTACSAAGTSRGSGASPMPREPSSLRRLTCADAMPSEADLDARCWARWHETGLRPRATTAHSSRPGSSSRSRSRRRWPSAAVAPFPGPTVGCSSWPPTTPRAACSPRAATHSPSRTASRSSTGSSGALAEPGVDGVLASADILEELAPGSVPSTAGSRSER